MANHENSPEPPNPSSDAYDDDDDFVVELPPAFERPFDDDPGPGHNPGPAAPPAHQPPYPGNPMREESSPAREPIPPRPERGGGGVSGVSAFFLGMLAQLIVLGIIGIAIYSSPKETGQFLEAAQKHFQVEEEAEPSTWAPTIQVETDVVARMEILELEDRAIYGHERVAWDELVLQAGRLDPADVTYGSVQASLMRIRMLYAAPVQVPPPPLDASAIFPGKTSEGELPPTAIIQVLRDKRQPADIRRRAAYLLGTDGASASGARALFDTIQDDPNLEVVKQAFYSFRSATGYPGEDFFDASAVETWWTANKGSFLGQN